jgi:chaperonin cofactor prefoldin|tara:strand:+ start:296 stop:514 length:219 start_codon:yes stop_codon:yes gene_type:complete
MMSEEDIKKYHALVEELELAKKNKTPVDDRGPADLTKQIEILEFRNEKLHKHNEKLTQEIRSLRSKLYVKEN